MTEAEEVQCPCCQLFYPRATPLRRGICRDCVNHQGQSDAVRTARGKHHGQMLRREYGRVREQLAEARQELAEARQELADRPVRVIERDLNAEVLASAYNDVEAAHHRRDVAMGALSDLRLLHRKAPADKTRCICRKMYANCKEAQIADGWDGIAMWELQQAERAWVGDYSYLRPGHPAAENWKWFRDQNDEAG